MKKIHFLYLIGLLILSSCEISKQGLDKLQNFIENRNNDNTDTSIDILNKNQGTNQTDDQTEYIEDSPLNLDDLNEIESRKTEASSDIDTTGTLNSKEVIYLVRQNRYAEVISGKIDQENMTSRYYRGIAYHVMAKINPTPIQRNLSYTKKAEADFKHVGIYSKNKNLKTKAILWHGITMYKLRFSPETVPEIHKAFDHIQNNFSETRYLNDSLLYSALTYVKSKNIKKAKSYLSELNNTDEEDKVYDIDYNRWLSPQETVAHYSKFYNLSGLKKKSRNLKKKIEERHKKLATDK